MDPSILGSITCDKYHSQINHLKTEAQVCDDQGVDNRIRIPEDSVDRQE